MNFDYVVFKDNNPIACFAEKEMAESFARLISGRLGKETYSKEEIEKYVIDNPLITTSVKIARIRAAKIIYNLDLLSAKKLCESLFQY